MTLKLIQPRIDLRIIHLLAPLSNTLEQQRLRVQFRIHPNDIKHDPGRGSIVSRTDDVPIADDEDEFPFVVILEYG